MVYTRTVEGKEIRLASSGKLYRDALVLYDPQSGAQWTQLDGIPLRDRKKGTPLQALASVRTTWGEWKKLHPDTLVLKKEGRVEDTLYTKYQNDARLGVAGTQNPDPRLPGKSLVVGLREGGDTLAIPVEALKHSPLHQSRLRGRPVAIVYGPGCGTTQVFDRRVDGRALKFEVVRRNAEVLLRDRETSTLWSGTTGKAIEGKLAGKQLAPLPYVMSYWFAWAAYHPGGRLEPSWAVQETPMLADR